jgi:hypothetical protein
MAIAHKFVSLETGDLLISLHDGEQPTDRQWNTLIEDLKAIGLKHHGDFSRIFALVITDGGAPSYAQREQLNNILNGKNFRISVLSDSLMVRGVATALGWFNPDIRPFSSKEIQACMAHLPIQRSEYLLVRREIQLLRHEIYVKTLSAAESWLRSA